MVTEIGLFESPYLTPSDFIGGGREFDKELALILDAAGRIKKREDQLRRKTRDLCTRVAKCTEVDGEIFEHLL
jgi:hypothetical protein